MKTKILLFCLFLIVYLNTATIAKAQAVNRNDSLVLVDLYNSTDGANWYTNKNWLTGPVKTWYGIVVAGTSVRQIVLRNNALNGIIPASIGNLANLDSFDLGRNDLLTGRIPPDIGNLTNLTYLNLESCNLNGRIPLAIGNLKKLFYLNLINNELSGIIPTSFGKLTKIGYINLAINQLSDTIPAVIGDLTNLTDLYLSDNLLTGIIPPSFGRLVKLSTLVLRNNRLSGILPPSIGNLRSLRYSYFDRNNLTGGIPSAITDIKSLIILELSKNKLFFSHNIDTAARLGNSQVLMNIAYNNFTFDGNEFFGQKDKYPNIIYTPQAPIAIHKHAGILAVSAGGTLSNNTYTWFKTGRTGSMVIQGDSTFRPSISGKYYATVTNSIATRLTLYTDTIMYTAPPATNKSSITMYPNPVKDMLHIFGLDENTNSNIIIADASGHVWLRRTAEQQPTATFNVSKLKPGYYVLNISNGSGAGQWKFIKE